MQQIFFFVQKYKYFLFFLLLEFFAIFLIINNHSFHKSKFISSANGITGKLYQKSSQFSDYFHLKDQNKELNDENIKLKNQLELLMSKNDTVFNQTIIDTLQFHQKYTYINAKIIKNEYHKSFNFLTVNRGKKQGVLKEMAVVNSKGIIGITDVSNKDYSRVQSILNKNSKINARLKNSFHFGTLIWNGKDYNTVQLIDIPKEANITQGDTIITGGKSTIFPEGVLIGTVIKQSNKSTFNNSIDIKLFNDMSNIGYVYVIKNLDKIEIKSLDDSNNE